MRRILPRSAIGFAAALLAACSLAPKYERPAVELPQAWKETAPRYAEDGRWWRIYNDDPLNTLVEEGLKGNADLLIAAARIDEARGILAEIEGGYYPTLDARGQASRQKISERTATFFPGVPQQYSDYRANLNISYDLDLFGRIRSSADAAEEVEVVGDVEVGAVVAVLLRHAREERRGALRDLLPRGLAARVEHRVVPALDLGEDAARLVDARRCDQEVG